MIIPDQRHLFDIPMGVVWLNASSFTPAAKAVTAAGLGGIAQEAQPWTRRISEDFYQDAEVARELFAGVINADADGVAVVNSASYGLAVAAANIPVTAGDRILVAEDQFPSNLYTWTALAQRTGAEVVTLPRPADLDWTGAFLDELDESVAIVAVANCLWTDGSLIDLPRLGPQVRAARAALVLDCTQTLGAYPFDATVVRPDFVVAGGYKSLLGPYGLGYLWVAPQWRKGRPLEENWLNRVGSEDFSRLIDYQDDYRPGAQRFDAGERSQFILQPMSRAALELVHQWGVDNIAETCGVLTADVEKRAAGLGLDPVPAARRVNHIIGVRMPSGVPAGLSTALAAAGTYVSVRGDSVRISPHVYNSLEDVERFFGVLEPLL